MRRPSKSKGQVLVAGIFILLILLLLILTGFDIFNALRAKFKVETAQESAALAGALWQKNSLNLIGEINLIKCCQLMLEGDVNWNIPLPQENAQQPEIRADALQARLDVLTEMQSRTSFIGPLIGFAAAQQAAKANGIPVRANLQNYLFSLDFENRYNPDFGGAPRYVNNYEWKRPYTELVRSISHNGIAVFPNARIGGSPVVYPSELRSEGFYRRILIHAAEIAAAQGGAVSYPQSSWNDATLRFVYRDTWKKNFASPPWWDIDYTLTKFPGESEIFTLGVSTESSPVSEYNENIILKKASETAKKRLSSAGTAEIYRDADAIPSGISLNFFCYDDSWYPEFYTKKYGEGYKDNHLHFWFDAITLRKKIKKQYRYEGPGAYVETFADVGRTSAAFRISGQRVRDYDVITRVGTKRTGHGDFGGTEYRPGTFAKVFGELPGELPPIAIPVILPVFDKVAIVPTYFPIPYGFDVLRFERNILERFLDWLSTQKSLYSSSPLPAKCEHYLQALKHLEKGPEFRYYGWNPEFDVKKFTEQWKDNLVEWHTERLKDPEDYQYNLKAADKTMLPGWLQEPQIFFKSAIYDEEQLNAVKCTDYVNGGYATRYYLNRNSYLVVDSTGRIVTNYDRDPTLKPLRYDFDLEPGGGGGYIPMGRGYDDQRGVPRL